jgi:hypothetical protein
VKNGITYYEDREMTEPAGDEKTSKIVVHVTDNSGKWGQKGLSAALASKWKSPQEKYEQEKPSLGDIQIVKVEENGQAKTYVCNMVILNAAENGAFNKEAYDDTILKLVYEAKKKQASVHFPRLSSSIPNLDWDGHIEKSLMITVAPKVPLFMYPLL